MGLFPSKRKNKKDKQSDVSDVDSWLQSADEPSEHDALDMVDLDSALDAVAPPPPPPAPAAEPVQQFRRAEDDPPELWHFPDLDELEPTSDEPAIEAVDTTADAFADATPTDGPLPEVASLTSLPPAPPSPDLLGPDSPLSQPVDLPAASSSAESATGAETFPSFTGIVSPTVDTPPSSELLPTPPAPLSPPLPGPDALEAAAAALETKEFAALDSDAAAAPMDFLSQNFEVRPDPDAPTLLPRRGQTPAEAAEGESDSGEVSTTELVGAESSFEDVWATFEADGDAADTGWSMNEEFDVAASAGLDPDAGFDAMIASEDSTDDENVLVLPVPAMPQATVLLEILGLEPGVEWHTVRTARAELVDGHDPDSESDPDRAALARAIRREMNTAYAALRLLYVA